MSRQQREAGEKQKQIGEDHPFVLQMQRQAGKARTKLEAGEGEFVARDDRETRERNIQRVMVEQSDPDQGDRKQHEIDRHAEQLHLVS